MVTLTGHDDDATGSTGGTGGTPGTTTRTPSRALDVIESSTAAQSATGVSQRFFTSARSVVVVARHDRAAQRRGIAEATTRGVPVLISDASVPREVERLGATTVLTSGRVRAVPGVRTRPVPEKPATSPATERSSDAIVLTRSRSANAVAVATARIAGATVLQVPDADPRRSASVAKTLRSRPDSPVVALGRPFARNLAYTVQVVRRDVRQPAGGFLALPGKRYTAMYGHPGAPQLGVLGEQGVSDSVKRVERLARKYRRLGKGTVVPTFEIIATIASGGPGKDKNYSTETPVSKLEPLVDAAAKHGIYVILDLQPGRTDFLTQAKRYRSLLERPNVGLALDPEWRLKPGQKHLRQIGSVKVAEINRTADWLAALTRRRTLPQKLFVLHQFSTSMIADRSKLDTGHAELATVLHVDGSGPQGAKQGTWATLRRDAPDVAGWGWKNFIDEDEPMLTAQQTWDRVRPRPDLITYQ
ncbi:hypothetical protein C3E78_17835 [Aeromicrobium chenweiae]|uniref:Uncharacterized protein n=1 Tax=Aeromicrobium chenweiae TaxID=2079793 RepID=A0A2S0WRI0_9ACTN|nr:hypothetical protein C3E78_17835 [Aeromicrobium chenweiae]